MKYLMMVVVVLTTVMHADASACGPKDPPKAMNAEASAVVPRCDITVLQDGVISGANKDDKFYVALGTGVSHRPLMPEGQKRITRSVVAFSFTLADSNENGQLLLVTGDTRDSLNVQIGEVAALPEESGPGDIPQPSKPPTRRQPVRVLKATNGVVTVLTDADFAYGVIYNPVTGDKLYELAIVKGG